MTIEEIIADWKRELENPIFSGGWTNGYYSEMARCLDDLKKSIGMARCLDDLKKAIESDKRWVYCPKCMKKVKVSSKATICPDCLSKYETDAPEWWKKMKQSIGSDKGGST